MRRVIRFVYTLLVVIVTGFVLLINARLYTSVVDPGRSDVPAQLAFMRSALAGGAAQEMQQYFPEGYFFSYALYGLAWVNWGLAHEAERTQALAEARWALAALDSPAGRAVFSPTLDPPYGVFYVGWSGLLRGGVLQLQGAARDAAEGERFQADMAALAAAFGRSGSPFLTAYPGQAWPVDSVVGVAALRLHDRLFPAQYEAVIRDWLAGAQARLDPATGLLPHRVRPDDGAWIEGARGSSQSLMNVFLPQIDMAWSIDQYSGFRDEFITSIAGIPGTLEYPRGAVGRGDVDSGPLLLGVSLSSSVVTAAAAQANQDRVVADAFLDVGEALGLPVSWGGTKRYALGVLPVGDAFLAWAKSVPPADNPVWPAADADAIAPLWRVPTHLISLLALALVWWPVVWRRRGRAAPGR